jgi:hypothetical protein
MDKKIDKPKLVDFFGSGIGIFPALCASRLASLVARVGENSHTGLFSSANFVCSLLVRIPI